MVCLCDKIRVVCAHTCTKIADTRGSLANDHAFFARLTNTSDSCLETVGWGILLSSLKKSCIRFLCRFLLRSPLRRLDSSHHGGNRPGHGAQGWHHGLGMGAPTEEGLCLRSGEQWFARGERVANRSMLAFLRRRSLLGATRICARLAFRSKKSTRTSGMEKTSSPSWR